jgi:hypothetical protein
VERCQGAGRCGSSAFILALTCTSSRDAQANAVETCRLVDVYQG